MKYGGFSFPREWVRFNPHRSAASVETGGYRFETVKGYAPQFQEMFDLGKGFRVFDFTLDGVTEGKKNTFADTFFPQLSGLGGDAFPSAQFAISRHKVPRELAPELLLLES